MPNRIISWFSCGAASTVATKLALAEFDRVEIIRQDTGSEHPDNERYFNECQEWFGQEIIVQKSEKYKDIWDVFEKTRWLAGVGGARCTTVLKRELANAYLNYGDIEIFGYTPEEAKRVERFKVNNPERRLYPILIERGLTKKDCLAMVAKAGIELPAMYALGYTNNNCIGCPKGQAGYWNKIRKDFPGVFERMSKMERELDVAINKKYIKGERVRVFLDELPDDMGNYGAEPDISCGIMCEIASAEYT